MKMLNAWTLELDDPQLAVAEIKEQLDLEHSLLAHAAGFITCSYDYVETGMVQAICEAMPFEVVGCTTLTNAVNAEAGTMLLCLSVLTADDCRFATVLSEPLDTGYAAAVENAYGGAVQQLGAPPKLTLAFMPMVTAVSGEQMLNALDAAANGAPVFGTIACDFDTAHYTHTFTIHNGRCTRERMALLLVCGNVAPRFVVTSTSEQNLHAQQAVITAAQGSVMQEVNGMSAKEYFHSIGLMQGSGVEGLSSVPFVVDYNDGTQPVARAIYSLTDDGAAVCGGVMPKGATLSIGRMDVEDILFTAEQSLGTLLQAQGVNGIITFPCLGRNMVLGVDPLAEVDRVRQVVGDALPWHLAYSGGEVCPVYSTGGGTVNRFHNFTFIACAI